MLSLIAAMCVFSLTMSISPGPVNMTIIASGVTYGFRRTFPFVSGATIGFILLLLSLGFGLVQVVTAYPTFLQYLSVAGATFIIYVGYKIATADSELSVGQAACPSFRQGFLMQWLNPKAWLACVAGISMFTDPHSHTRFLIFASLYFVICYLSLALWAAMGKRIGTLLTTRKTRRMFNMTMGTLLCACAAYILFTSLPFLSSTPA